jgi:hypothetical protein
MTLCIVRRLVCCLLVVNSQGTSPVPLWDGQGFVENALLCPGSSVALNEGLMKAVNLGWTRAVTALLDGGASPQASSVGLSAVLALRRTPQRLLGFCGGECVCILMAAYDSWDRCFFACW